MQSKISLRKHTGEQSAEHIISQKNTQESSLHSIIFFQKNTQESSLQSKYISQNKTQESGVLSEMSFRKINKRAAIRP